MNDSVYPKIYSNKLTSANSKKSLIKIHHDKESKTNSKNDALNLVDQETVKINKEKIIFDANIDVNHGIVAQNVDITNSLVCDKMDTKIVTSTTNRVSC